MSDGRVTITREAIELFARLDATPMRQRSGDAFKADEKRLMIMLSSGYEYLTLVRSVVDRDTRNPFLPHLAAHTEWPRLHEVRLALVAATARQ